jgi:hypothetical protein
MEIEHKHMKWEEPKQYLFVAMSQLGYISLLLQ